MLGTCEFFLGDTSGPACVAASFGRSLVTANFQIGYAPWQLSDLYTPKLYRDSSTGKLISFKASLTPPLFRSCNNTTLAHVGIEVVDNTAHEIADLTAEMLERLDGTLVYSANDDLLQSRINGLFPSGTAIPNSRIGKTFLQTYQGLLDERLYRAIWRRWCDGTVRASGAGGTLHL